MDVYSPKMFLVFFLKYGHLSESNPYIII
uniref:Uncharacterized protein n=1 Tax=Lepeophtheirus salmonis TaxID=72036 RepID=A0A0K2U7H7_LEPSM